MRNASPRHQVHGSTGELRARLNGWRISSSFRVASVGVLLVLAVSVWFPGSMPSARAQVAGSVLTVGPYTVFTQPGAHLSPVLHLIRSAQKSLRLEVYLLTSSSIVNELSNAHRRGVDVRVLLEQRPYGAGRYAQLGYSKLQAAGVPVRWANENAFTYTHEKAMEIDGTTAGIFTFNLSTSGMLSNREFGVIERNPSDARTIAGIFDADWNRSTPRVSTGDLVVSPINSRHTFSALIDSARSTLDVYAEEVADTSIESRLVAAARRGVRVRLLAPASSAGVDLLRQDGVMVKLQSNPYVHAKVLVADGHRFYLGSENISATSLDKNREMGITLDNRPLAGFLERTFASDWGNSAGATSEPPTRVPGASTRRDGLRVQVTVSPAALTRGSRLTIAVTTTRGAGCSVRVTYPNRYTSRSRALRNERTADRNGRVSWSFTVGTSSTGTGSASVHCSLNGSSGDGSAVYEVR